jgi:hypothetical protein
LIELEVIELAQREASVQKREPRKIEPPIDSTIYPFNPAAPKPYNQSDRYAVKDRLHHPTLGFCLVIGSSPDRIVVQTGLEPEARILVHGRTIAVMADLAELVRDYGEPLSLTEVASYCGITDADARRQLDVLIRRGDAARVGDQFVCTFEEFEVA